MCRATFRITFESSTIKQLFILRLSRFQP